MTSSNTQDDEPSKPSFSPDEQTEMPVKQNPQGSLDSPFEEKKEETVKKENTPTRFIPKEGYLAICGGCSVPSILSL